MKKKFFVIGTVLAMLVIMVFPCYGGAIYGCYQKNNGQLRIVKDLAECRPMAEKPITLYGEMGGQEVPKICSGTVCYGDVTRCNGDNFISSCATIGSHTTGYYQIAFDFTETPICVIYPHQPYRMGSLVTWIWTEILSSSTTGMEVNTYIGSGESRTDVDADFSFICTQ